MPVPTKLSLRHSWLYFAIIFNSGLELEDLDRHTSLSQIISLHRECKVDSQY